MVMDIFASSKRERWMAITFSRVRWPVVWRWPKRRTSRDEDRPAARSRSHGAADDAAGGWVASWRVADRGPTGSSLERECWFDLEDELETGLRQNRAGDSA